MPSFTELEGEVIMYDKVYVKNNAFEFGIA